MTEKLRIRKGEVSDISKWSVLYSEPLGRHEDWYGKIFLVAVDKESMPVAACFLVESDSGKSAQIDYIESHKRNAGLELIKYLQGRYAVLKSEAVTEKGEILLKRAGFGYKSMTSLGPLYIWRRPKYAKRESSEQVLQRSES